MPKGNRKNMGSETEGGVLDIHFDYMTDVDICRISLVEKNTCCMSTTPTAAMETLLGLPSLQLVVEKEERQAAYRLHCSNHFKKSDWGHFANFKMTTDDFPVLLAPSDSILPLEVFDRKYLVEYPSRKI
jgi:hypothetical protein